MYSFRSTSDFDNKIGYVSDTTHCVDWYGSSDFYPLEPMYEFDNLFSRFKTEIDNAIEGETTYDSGNLLICKGVYLSSGDLTTSYAAVRVTVNSERVRVYFGAIPNRSGRLNSHADCPISDYLSGTHLYNIGRIYFDSHYRIDTVNGGIKPNEFSSYLRLGDTRGYIGHYVESGGYHSTYGQMVYEFSTFTIPSLVAPGSADQTGYPRSIANTQNQPEIVAQTYNAKYMSFTTADAPAYFCDDNGEYDPDPTPPGPSPFDPNQDPNHEPGDNPTPRPGGHERDYDPIPIPPTPTVTSLGAGFTSLYVPTEAILHVLADEIFSDNIIQIIENYFNNPQDMIAGLSLVPFVVPVSGQYYHKVGRYTSSVAMQRASSQFIDVDCGSVLIDHYYNNFLDTSPFTKIKIWLPYIGYQDLSVDDVIGCTVSVKYRCDILSGACVAFIYTGLVGETGPQVERVIAQYSGNCAVQVPTGSESYDNMISTAINILTTAGATAVGGGGMMAAVEGIASSAANYITSMKPDVRRNGTPGSTSGYMAVQKPYIIRFTPRSSIPDDFINLKGYASNRSGQLGAFLGYVEVDSIKLENVAATDGEIQEILSLLQGGVFV